MRRGETGVPGENLSVQRREPINSTHISLRIWESNLRIEPGPHWWETSALTTAPALRLKAGPLLATYSGNRAMRQANENNTVNKVRFITVMVINYNHYISILLIIMK